MGKRNTTGLKHIHKIVRFPGGRSYIYKCADPNCSFLIHHAQLYHLLGRAIHCFGCGNPFNFTEANILPGEPSITMCDKCITPGIDEVASIYEKPKSELTQYFEALEDNAKTH